MKFKRILILLALLLLPLIAGIVLTYLSEGWFPRFVFATGGSISPQEEAAQGLQVLRGFPFRWEVVDFLPCPPGQLADFPCGVQTIVDWAGFALDLAFYSLIGYVSVATLVIAQRRQWRKSFTIRVVLLGLVVESLLIGLFYIGFQTLNFAFLLLVILTLVVSPEIYSTSRKHKLPRAVEPERLD